MASFPGQKAYGPSVAIITSPSVLPNAEIGANYSFQFTATGGAPPYTWNPPSIGELTLSPAGLLFNTAPLTTATVLNFSVTVTDSKGNGSTFGFQLTVLAQPTITTTSPLPQANVGIPYRVTIGVTGGTPPYTFAILSGQPSWMSFDTVNGIMTGTPTTVETDTIVVQVTDSY